MTTTLTLSVGTAQVVGNADYPVDPANAADFERVYKHLIGRPNTEKISVNLPTAEAAEDYRKQIKSWCAANGLSAYLPEYSPEHTVERTDKATGKVVKKVVKANNVPKHYNVGRNVTFRITKPKTDDE